MTQGWWYCNKERTENVHKIVGDYSVCSCGYKRKLKPREDAEGNALQAAEPKEVRVSVRSPFIRAHAPY